MKARISLAGVLLVCVFGLMAGHSDRAVAIDTTVKCVYTHNWVYMGTAYASSADACWSQFPAHAHDKADHDTTMIVEPDGNR